MANEVAVKKPELLALVKNTLETMLTEQAKALPKGFNRTRFLQNCITVLADTEDIERCTSGSIIRTLIKGAYLDLDFFRRECYAIPYGTTCTFIPDYKGSVKLAKKYGKGIKDIYAKVVQEGDELDIGVESGAQHVNFRQKPFNDGKIIGTFAVVLFTDGTLKYETMSVKDIEQTRNVYSKMPKSKMWMNSYGEACKKTVLNRLTKMIDLHFANREQEKAYTENDEFDQGDANHAAEKPKVENVFKPSTGPASTDAVIVDPDAEIKAELRKKNPTATEFDIEEMVEEAKKERAQ